MCWVFPMHAHMVINYVTSVKQLQVIVRPLIYEGLENTHKTRLGPKIWETKED